MAEFKIYEGNPQLTPDRQQVGTDALSIVADGLKQVANAQVKLEKARSAEEKRLAVTEYNINRAKRSSALETAFKSQVDGVIEKGVIIDGADVGGQLFSEYEKNTNEYYRPKTTYSSDSEIGMDLAKRREQDDFLEKNTSLLRNRAITEDVSKTQFRAGIDSIAMDTTMFNFPERIIEVEKHLDGYPHLSNADKAKELKAFRKGTLDESYNNEKDGLLINIDGSPADSAETIAAGEVLIKDIKKYYRGTGYTKSEIQNKVDGVRKVINKAKIALDKEVKLDIDNIIYSMEINKKFQMDERSWVLCETDRGCVKAYADFTAKGKAAIETDAVVDNPDADGKAIYTEKTTHGKRSENEMVNDNAVEKAKKKQIKTFNKNMDTKPVETVLEYSIDAQVLQKRYNKPDGDEDKISSQQFLNGITGIIVDKYKKGEISDFFNTIPGLKNYFKTGADGKGITTKELANKIVGFIGNNDSVDSLNTDATTALWQALEDEEIIPEGGHTVGMFNGTKFTTTMLNANLDFKKKEEILGAKNPDIKTKYTKALRTQLQSEYSYLFGQLSSGDLLDLLNQSKRLAYHYVVGEGKLTGRDIRESTDKALSKVIGNTITKAPTGFGGRSIPLENKNPNTPEADKVESFIHSLHADNAEKLWQHVDIDAAFKVFHFSFSDANLETAKKAGYKHFKKFLSNGNHFKHVPDDEGDGFKLLYKKVVLPLKSNKNGTVYDNTIAWKLFESK